MSRAGFVDDAEAFARSYRGAWPFRYLAWLTGASGPDLEALIAKIYADALPESSTGVESALSSATRSLSHPFAYALSKKILWRRSDPVVSDLETIDRAYFEKWFARIFATLKAPKRLTPRTSDGFPEFRLAEPIGRTVSPGTLAKLFLAPFWIPWLLFAPPKAVRPRFLRAYRKALSFFAIYDGHFDRFPTRDFITFADESNHPSRYLAFKRHCRGRLIVIQNGGREVHPVHAFGMVDTYLLFGEFARKSFSDLRLKAGRTEVVGALCLNEMYPLYLDLQKQDSGARYDILFIDQSIWPLNGVDKEAGDGLLKIIENLGLYHEKHPNRRVAYQLRVYGGSTIEKEAVLAAIRPRLRGVEILENNGKGESYANIFRSDLVLTFGSTLGIEAFYFGGGKKALFVNYTGSDCHDFAPESRYQLTDKSGNYEAFERKVDELLLLRLEVTPESVKQHHAYFDGKVEERIAAVIAEEQK